ncbi:MAG: glycerophosphodiester phosphodiesterase [Clostridia bacterium]|nr:glycerophosphodiester phosphodiesterase [Clostridia bacterium]
MKIIAHRGAIKRAPQNTLAAFRAALEMNIDGVETDVHFTKDGKVVLCHNTDIDATSDGTGFINDMSFDELRGYDFGGYFGEAFKGEKAPELTEFLELVKDVEIINIEIKTPHNSDYSIVDETLNAVAERGLSKQLLISSFDPVALRRVRELDPEIRTGLLYDMTKDIYRDIRPDPVAYALKLGCRALHPFKFNINAKIISRAHEYGLDVNPWTVDNVRTAKRLQRIGADSLITNVPDVMERFKD